MKNILLKWATVVVAFLFTLSANAVEIEVLRVVASDYSAATSGSTSTWVQSGTSSLYVAKATVDPVSVKAYAPVGVAGFFSIDGGTSSSGGVKLPPVNFNNGGRVVVRWGCENNRTIGIRNVTVTATNGVTVVSNSADRSKLFEAEYIVSDNGPATMELHASGSSAFFFEILVYTNSKGPEVSTFSLAAVAGTVDVLAGTIAVTVPFGTNLTSLVPTFTLTPSTSFVTPADATTPRDFSIPVSYQFTDGTDTKTYTVTVTTAPASTACNIETFTVPNQVGISQFIPAAGLAKDSIIVTMPFSTSPATIAALTPTYTPSPLVSATAPASGVTQDFTNPVSYVVTAEDVTVSKEYIVRVKKAPASVKCVIDSLKGFAAKEQISFNPSTLTYDIVVPSASNLSSLSPQIFFSPLSSNTGIPTDYTTAQTIVVTAEDGLAQKTYTINVTKDNTPPSLLSSKPANGAIDYSLAGLMSLKYSEPIDLGTKALSISGGGVLGTVSIIDSVAKFSFSNLTKLTTYTVTIPDSAFQDKLGNYCAASSFSFTTANDVFLKVDTVYASHMTAESYDLPAFITGSNFTTVKYDPTADVKATTTTQYGAYVIPPGEKLIIKAEQVGSVLASIYAKGGNRSYTISSNIDPLVSSGNFIDYDNNGATISWIPTSISTTNPTEIYITNTSAAGDIYVPYIYINALGSTVVDEQSMYCTSVAP